MLLWVGACAKFATDEPDASSTDASSGTDVSTSSDGATKPDVTKPIDGSCAQPTTKCSSDAGDICANLTNDENHCGACTTICETADASGLSPGTNNPNPGIFDAGYDGGIGWSLGSAACATSTCGVDCPDAMALCSDEICYDTQNHHDHCGTCTTACAQTSEWCTQGHCCGVGSAWCGSSCASVLTDTQNCGACGHACDGGGCQNGVCASCVPATLTGPALTMNISGWARAGLRITALKNTTLTSFVVNNQGAADTIDLTDTSGTVLQTIALPANSTAYTASVSWALTANTSYDLILEGGANGLWASYSSFPQSSAGLEIVDTVDTSQTLQTNYWFTFTSLVSCP
jgi:hypothetical protein